MLYKFPDSVFSEFPLPKKKMGPNINISLMIWAHFDLKVTSVFS